MSSEALAWAFKTNIRSSALKFTLVALCECANYRTGHIYPSLAQLEEITGQNRKTLIANIAKLEEVGLIEDTGQRAGRTGQIKVYRAKTETVPKTEPYQKRNSSVFTRKESQKRDTEPSKEPSVDKAKALPTTRTRSEPVEIPDWIPAEPWAGYVAMRRSIGKPLAGRAITLAIQKLKALANDGHPPGEVLDQSTAASWQGLFPLKDKSNVTKSVNRGGSTRSAAELALQRMGHC